MYMTKFLRLSAFAACAALFALAPAANAQGPWKSMFNGKDWTGWKINDAPEKSWKIENGMIVAFGPRSHAFWMVEECEDCEFEAEIMQKHNSNSGMYFRAQWCEQCWPNGYEAQVNNTSTDWKRTGSLYNIVNVKEQLVQDDTWWKQTIIAKGDHIIIKVNDKVVVDTKDATHKKGYLALQSHDPNSVTHFRNLRMRKL
jgi:hypothetical protein